MFSLIGQKALITGASGGIGGSIARVLAHAGAEVVLSGTRQSALDEVAHSITSSGGVAHTVIAHLDVMDSVEALFPRAEELLGQIDILVNNAGLTRDQLTIRMKDEDWDQVIAVNLTAGFKLCRAAVKSMTSRRYGRIINMASIVGVTGNMGQANYCASKAGLIGMTKAMALETATRGVTINAIAPGFIATPMTGAIPESVKEKILTKIPMQKMGTPDDIAAAALFLASQEAGYVTGMTLHVNGGMTMV